MTEMSDFDKSKSLETAHKDGTRGRSNAYLEQLMPVGKCIWKDHDFGGGVKYGIFLAPATMHTNETESGADVALWVTEIKMDKKGKITRKPTIVADPKKGKRCFYQHIIFPWDTIYPVAQAMLGFVGKPEVIEAKSATIMTPVDSEQAKIDAAMRKLGLLGGV
jgi:hypothetical protein